MPDSLVNSLIRHSDGTVQRVIRDDGENGLHISPPNNPVAMRPITREEFRNDWELHQTVSDQLTSEGREDSDKEQSFRGRNAKSGTVVESVDLTSQRRLPSIDSRNGVNTNMSQNRTFEGFDPFEGRTSPTERLSGEELEDYLATEATDVTFSGEPVGGNEEPAELQDPARTDPDTQASAPENAQEEVQEQHGDPEPKKRTTSKK